MVDLLRALWPPILLRPWFLYSAGALALVAGLFVLFLPEPLVRLSLLSDPKTKRPSLSMLRWVLAPSLLIAGIVTLWYAWFLQAATR